MATEVHVDPVDEFGEEGDLSASEVQQTQQNAKNILSLLTDKVKQLELQDAQTKTNVETIPKLQLDTSANTDNDESDNEETPTLTRKQKKKKQKIMKKEAKLEKAALPSSENTMSGGILQDQDEKLDWADDVVADEPKVDTDIPESLIEVDTDPDALIFNSAMTREELMDMVKVQGAMIEQRSNQVEQLTAKIFETEEFARSLKQKVEQMEISFKNQLSEINSIQSQILAELALRPKFPALPVTPILGSIAAQSDYSEIAPSQISDAPLPPMPSTQFKRSFIFEE
ncbi:hypothetical protein [Botrytis cinerea negative-stranded RNA virus 5]|uniref:Uncharacterized protein n=1 Tax=Botrytis cinerea negative-stranded RNA virus 5 TaxID=2735940 RepID=A0AAE7ARV6_9MONO|nr:hypothetical protein QKS23_gp4 [Botrytis cinerea negative-stranded RNA virus 5]QJW39409.1 hypothetical protein [Botrytis cinerea negative-stranded RNA virus 5]